MHTRHALAFFPLVLAPAVARAQAPFELWSDAAPRRDGVLELAGRARARAELRVLTTAVSTPCARFTHRALPFFASHTIARPYEGASPLHSFRLETCLRLALGQSYENRTPLLPLACSFTGFGAHVKLALDPAGTEVLLEYDAFLPTRTYPRLGYDGSFDFDGVSGTRMQLAAAQRDQRILTLDEEGETRFRAAFTVYATVSMLHGTIAGMGAYSARADGDGAVLVHADVDGDGAIDPAGEPSPNGASLAVVFHWGDTEIAP